MDDSTEYVAREGLPSDKQLRAVELRTGRPPRPLSLPGLAIARARRPCWVTDDDPMVRLFLMQDQIVRNGEVRWAHVVHANTTLFAPGAIDHGAQVVYAPQGDVPLHALESIARRLFALKGTRPEDPAERKLADMLTDECERALDWPVPPSLTEGRNAVTTVVILPRQSMPGGVLAQSYFPILADPKSLLATYVPVHFWPESLRKPWEERAEGITQAFLFNATTAVEIGDDDEENFVERPVIELTESAAAMLRRTAEQSEAEEWLHVSVRYGAQGAVTHHMEFTRQVPNEKTQLACERRGVAMMIDHAHVSALAGTVIDYRGKLGSGVFVFDNPNLEPRAS